MREDGPAAEAGVHRAPAAHGPRGGGARAALLALLAYLAAAGWMLAPALLDGEVVSPSSHFLRSGPFPKALAETVPDGADILSDATRQFQPWLHYAARALAEDGALPLWKATALCGAPLVGNAQSALFFPPNLVAIALGMPAAAHAALAAVKLVGGAMAAWLLARHLGLSGLACLLAGLVFGFGGFQKVWLLHPHTNVSMLFPLLLLAADRVVLSPTFARIALLAGVAGLQHLGGHPETAFHAQVVALVLGGVRAFSLRGSASRDPASRAPPLRSDSPGDAPPPPGGPAVAGRVGALLLGLCLGAALGAVQILPLVEYMAHSDSLQRRRAAQPLSLAEHPVAGAAFLVALAGGAFVLRRLARGAGSPWRNAAALALLAGGGCLAGFVAGLSPALVAPLSSEWFGNVRRWFGPLNFVEVNGGFAGAALVLALVGLLLGRPRGPALAAGAALALGWLAGARAPLLDDLFSLLPGFSMAVNHRLSLVALLATAVLAGCGLDALGRVRRAPALRVLLAALALGAGVAGSLLVAYATGLAYPSHLRAPDPGSVIVSAGLLPVPNEMLPPPPEPGDEPLILIGGWFQSEVRPRELRLLYADGDQGRSVGWMPATEGLLVSVSVWQERIGEPLDPRLPVYLFGATVPRDWLPPDPVVLRLRLRHGENGIGWSRPLRAPASQGMLPGSLGATITGPDGAPDLLASLAERPFPMSPAPGRAGVQLLLLMGTLVGAAGLCRASGPALAAGRTALVAACALSLSTFAPEIPPTLPRELYLPRSAVLDLLAERLGSDGRLMTLHRHAMMPEIPTAYGLRDVLGYDALHPRRVAQLAREAADLPGVNASLETLPLRTDPKLPLLGMMSVRVITDASGLRPPLPELRFPGELRWPAEKPFLLAENPRFLSRARIVHEAVVEKDDERAVSRLGMPGFPHGRIVMLHEWIGTPPPQPPAGAPPDRAAIVADRPDHLAVEVETAAPGWLVVSDTHYPGWTARVDGEERPVLRANHAFRAVELRPGDRRVDFRYEPLSVRLGAALSLGAALLLAGGLLRRRTPGRSARPQGVTDLRG